METLVATGLRKTFLLTRKQRQERKDGARSIVAVDNLSLSLRDGEIYGLLGPNGAGKTTALRLMATLIKPDDGTISWMGKDIRGCLTAYKKKLGFLTSELRLDDFFTPSDTFVYMARLYGLSEEQIARRKDLLFDRFGIRSFEATKIHDLSTGMKQKVSLAISLAHDPDIVIFDEPTNGLDIVATKDVEDFLLDLRKEGKTILVSTHIFSLVEKLCDRVGILLSGRLALEGNLKELTKERTLEDVFFALYGGER